MGSFPVQAGLRPNHSVSHLPKSFAFTATSSNATWAASSCQCEDLAYDTSCTPLEYSGRKDERDTFE